MVDVAGLDNFRWRMTDKCAGCTDDLSVSKVEWCIRETLVRVLAVENHQFSQIFQLYGDKITFTATSTDFYEAFQKRQTLGVYAKFLGHQLYTIPVLVGSKMYGLICNNNTPPLLITASHWDNYVWQPPGCLFCCKRADITPTVFLVKGKVYTLGQLAWTNYEKVVHSKKYKGFIMYNKLGGGTTTADEFPPLRDFDAYIADHTTSIGNRKVFNGGYVFTEILKQSLRDINNMANLKEPSKINLFVNRMVRNHTKSINSGGVDSVIGKHTVFNAPDSESVQATKPKYFNTQNVGRYKVITKLDYTAICRTLQLDVMTTLFSRRIPTGLQLSDVGFLCLVASSEHSPGISNLETVLGCIVSSETDCLPQNGLEEVLSAQLGDDLHSVVVVSEASDASDWLYVIINQCIFKHYVVNGGIDGWVSHLRRIYKVIRPCVEVVKISHRLYVIYSLPLTLYKIMPDGLAYSASELSTSSSLFADMLLHGCNLHGPTALLISNLNSNHLVRNTMNVHSIKQSVTGIPSPLIRSETYMLNCKHLIDGVPFKCIKANVLILPLPYNVEDACVLNSKSVTDKKLFTVCHKLVLTVQLEGVHFVKPLLQPQKREANTKKLLIRPGTVFMKFRAGKVAHVGKHLSVRPDVFDQHVNVNCVEWTPNTDVIVAHRQVYLRDVQVTYTTATECYCDFTVEYEEDASEGTKLVILNGAQKSVVGHVMPVETVPRLHKTPQLDVYCDCGHIDVDVIQNPHSLKRMGMNFLFSKYRVYNDCFRFSINDRLQDLNDRNNTVYGDYYVSDPETKCFYLDQNGAPMKALLYQGAILIMGKQNPYTLLHSADENTTPVSLINGQPEVNYRTSQFVPKNSHAFGLSESERELCMGIGLNGFVEQMHDLSDGMPSLVLENVNGDQVSVPSSATLVRTLDMLALAGIDVDFSVKHLENIDF